MAGKRRTAAQKRATRKLVALNRGRKRTRRRNPARTSVRRSPRRRPTMRTYVANPRRKRRIRRRRNPSGGRLTMRNVMNRNVMPAFQGAAGGLLLDVVWGYVPDVGGLNLKAGQLRHVFKGVGAIGLGMVAQQFMRPATATALTTGALTTVMHTAMREMLPMLGLNIPLGYYNAGEIASPQYADNNMGEYMGQVPYGTPLTPMGEYMGPDDGNMSYYETGIEGDLMGMGVGTYE